MHVFDIEFQKVTFWPTSPLRISARQLSQFIQSVAQAVTTSMFVSSFINVTTFSFHCTGHIYQ